MESAVTTANGDVEHFRKLMRNGGTLPRMEPPETNGDGHGANGKTTTGKVRKPASIARFTTMNEFIDLSARNVDTTAQAVWFVLFRETKPNGAACISFGQIAERIGASRRTVIRAVKHLENAKLISVVKRGRMNEGPSTYRVHGTPKLTPT